MKRADPYRKFIESKIKLAVPSGLEIAIGEVSPLLKPHQRDIVRWCVRGGRRAVFASFGLGKTLIQLEVLRLVLEKAGGRGLIVLPLGVRQEFIRDAAMLGTPVKFIRSIDEADTSGIYLTNYETVRDGKLDPAEFTAASLDEASILRGFGGTKTFREFMAKFAGDARGDRKCSEVRYRFVATATPSPNEYIELLAYAAYLGIMDVGQAKTRFFQRNSEKNDDLTLYPHKEREFWLWVASWAVFVQRPSDLGHSDEGYELPPLTVRWHEVPSDHTTAGADRAGQGRLFRNAAISLSDAAKEKRDNLAARMAKLKEIISYAAIAGREECLQQGVLCEEQGTASDRATGSRETELSSEPASVSGEDAEEPTEAVRSNVGSVPGHSRRPERRLRDLHDDARITQDGGGSLPRDGGSARDTLSAMQPSARDVRRQPGTADAGGGLSDQLVVWCDLNDEQRAIEKALKSAGLTFSSLYGSQAIEDREALLEEWRAKRTAAFVSKPMMYGAGVNLQQCHTMIFVGIGYKFQDLVQAIHRIHRFQQQHPCEVHIIYSEAEREIRARLEEKWARHKEQAATMSQLIREHGLASAALADGLVRTIGIGRTEASGELWRMVQNDCVDETRSMLANSVDLIVTSIPFEGQYEYTPSYNDFGHTESSAEFWAQMDFLIPELLRVLKPGRVCAVHVKDRITPGGLNGFGFQTVTPVSDYCTAHFVKHGFAFLARKTIVTDVVRENNQTYRLGWTEQCKDGSRMGAGLPEYLMLFRRPPSDRSDGYADHPVVKDKPLSHDREGNVVPYEQGDAMIPGTGYSRSRWQIDAHGFERSSGNRFLQPGDLVGIEADAAWKLWKQHSLSQVYDFEHHVACCEAREAKKELPKTFFLLPPHSWHPDVWTDITRMRTLNGAQSAAGRELHICPLQFDIVDRVIVQCSMKGETVFDPFAGLGTVPYCAIKLGRRGLGVDLNGDYFRDAIIYCEQAEREASVPTLFDILNREAAA